MVSGSGAGFFPLIRVTEVKAASAMGGYSTMCRRADEQGESGIYAVLGEIGQYVEAERSRISAEPILTEHMCRMHLPKIEEMQVCQSLSSCRFGFRFRLHPYSLCVVLNLRILKARLSTFRPRGFFRILSGNRLAQFGVWARRSGRERNKTEARSVKSQKF